MNWTHQAPTAYDSKEMSAARLDGHTIILGSDCRCWRTVMTEFTRRTVLSGLSALAAMPAFAETAWPNRPITLLIGFPAGGPLDVVSRIIAQGLSRGLCQQVVGE